MSRNSLLSLKLDECLLHSLLGVGNLVLQARLLGKGHTELGELEEDLEVREEVDHIGSVNWVADGLEQFALLALGVHVHALSDTLKPGTLTILGVALLNFLGIDNIVSEDFSTIPVEVGLLIVEDHLADGIEDLAAGGSSRALASREDLLDLLDVRGIHNLDELGLGLTHTLNELLEVTELLRVGGRLGLGRLVSLLEALLLSVGSIPPVSDLFSYRRVSLNRRSTYLIGEVLQLVVLSNLGLELVLHLSSLLLHLGEL